MHGQARVLTTSFKLHTPCHEGVERSCNREEAGAGMNLANPQLTSSRAPFEVCHGAMLPPEDARTEFAFELLNCLKVC